MTEEQLEQRRAAGRALAEKRGREYMAQIGKKGGKTVSQSKGREYMSSLGRSGAIAFHKKYRLMPVGTSDFAIIDRVTGETIGTMNGKHIPRRQEQP